MSAPSTCSFGLTYFQDLAAGPGVDPAWSTSGSFVVTADGYAVEDTPGETLGQATQTLGGTPTIIQADLTLTAEVFNNLATTGDRFYFVSVYPHDALARYSLDLVQEVAGTDVTPRLKLRVRGDAGFEFTTVLASGTTWDIVTGPFPNTATITGTLKVIQIAANNVEVYWNDVLQYTTVSGEHAITTAARLLVRREGESTDNENYFGAIKNISYVGPSGLGTDCPITGDGLVSSRGDLEAASAPGMLADGLVSSRGNLSAESSSDFAADFPAKGLLVEGQFALRGESTDEITQDMNDYDMEQGPAAAISNLTATGGSWNLTGLMGGETNRIMLLRNVGGSNNIVLKDLDGASATENQFDLGGDVTLTPGDSVLLIYTEYLSKWKKFPTL